MSIGYAKFMGRFKNKKPIYKGRFWAVPWCPFRVYPIETLVEPAKPYFLFSDLFIFPFISEKMFIILRQFANVAFL